MKLVESKYEILPQDIGLEGIYKQIELAGRVCYKSEDKICEGSAKKMVDFLVNRNHGSPLEHGTVYLYFSTVASDERVNKYSRNKYSKVVFVSNVTFNNSKLGVKYGQAGHYVTTNYRVLVENNWLDDLQYLCEPTKHHEKRYTVKIRCSIGVSRELNRHRANSICESSTRYCNYSLDKFGNEITFVIPDWVKVHTNDLSEDDFANCQHKFVKQWWEFLRYSEFEYMGLLKSGLKPQDARSVLPLDTATEVIYTAFTSDWEHFFKLRTAVGAHPDARAIVCPLEAEFKLKNYI